MNLGEPKAKLAGYLRKKSVELVKCETNDLEVPANADFVIEGYVDPTEPLRDEGPVGDHTGYYTLPEPYPVFHVTAITHRKDAVYPATIVGIPPMEDFYIGGASVKLFLPIFKMNFPEIVDLALPAEGVIHNLVFVSIRKTYPMQARKIMHGLWGMGLMKSGEKLTRCSEHKVQFGKTLFNSGKMFSSLGQLVEQVPRVCGEGKRDLP